MVGCNIHTVDGIIPEYQHAEASEGLRFHHQMLPIICEINCLRHAAKNAAQHQVASRGDSEATRQIEEGLNE